MKVLMLKIRLNTTRQEMCLCIQSKEQYSYSTETAWFMPNSEAPFLLKPLATESV
ncbi:unnamed protein product [Gulo gulo]|uniref:Uncharacterized protein n=1 Tax=Gulo gulo TaxID=48420 RepID=A0A9X9LJT7_GULGU|nr:unnamed protein product [Gulo gulo]